MLLELGKTGEKLPPVGIGMWRYQGKPEALREAIDAGAELIDTAELYGTERLVGAAIHDIRKRVFVATKVSGNHLGYEEVIEACKASLRRLKTSYIDLYQIHWPNPGTPLGPTMQAMEKLVDDGLIRYIGVSNFWQSNLEEAMMALKKHKIVSNQMPYSYLNRKIETDALIRWCKVRGISIIAYSPLASGDIFADANFKRVALPARMSMKLTDAQVALSWVINQGVFAIPKSNHAQRMISNVKTMAFWDEIRRNGPSEKSSQLPV